MCRVQTGSIGYGAGTANQSTAEIPMRSLVVCCLAGAAQVIACANPAATEPTPAIADAAVFFAQAEQGVPKQQQQKRSRGGVSEQQMLQNPMVQQMLRDPDLQQQFMDDPRFQGLKDDPQTQRLMQDPRVQRQMQQNQQLRQMFELQKRPLPGVLGDDDG